MRKIAFDEIICSWVMIITYLGYATYMQELEL